MKYCSQTEMLQEKNESNDYLVMLMFMSILDFQGS